MEPRTDPAVRTWKHLGFESVGWRSGLYRYCHAGVATGFAARQGDSAGKRRRSRWKLLRVVLGRDSAGDAAQPGDPAQQKVREQARCRAARARCGRFSAGRSS